jgi:hypothetical protein
MNQFKEKVMLGYEDLVSIKSYENIEQGGPQGQGCFYSQISHRF